MSLKDDVEGLESLSVAHSSNYVVSFGFALFLSQEHEDHETCLFLEDGQVLILWASEVGDLRVLNLIETFEELHLLPNLLKNGDIFPREMNGGIDLSIFDENLNPVFNLNGPLVNSLLSYDQAS